MFPSFAPKRAFDLHLHSCLSPCGGEEMTPATIAGLCAVQGIEICALTDHNSTKNCPAFLRACAHYGLMGLAGMELTTREEVHVIILFEDLDGALGFGRMAERWLEYLPENNPAVFGPQLILDEEDNLLGQETRMLAGSCDIGIYDVAYQARKFGGFAYPAHIDRPSFSLLANLGLWDEAMGFPCAEVSRSCPPDLFQRADLRNVPHFSASDAHYLNQIQPAHQFVSPRELSPQGLFAELSKLQNF